MRSATFGRKGPAGGPSQPSTFGTEDEPDDEMARKREAFIQAERARAAAENDAFGGGEPGLSSVAYSKPLAFDGSSAPIEKSIQLAYFLWFFGSVLSAHRFYLGAYRSAVAQCGSWMIGMLITWATMEATDDFLPMIGVFLTLGSSAWMLFDAVLIPGLLKQANASLRNAAATFG